MIMSEKEWQTYSSIKIKGFQSSAFENWSTFILENEEQRDILYRYFSSNDLVIYHDIVCKLEDIPLNQKIVAVFHEGLIYFFEPHEIDDIINKELCI